MTLGHRIVVMNGGVIQQVDTPLNLYQEPVNRFVAGFIGSPAMNFITGNVNEKCFTAGALQLKSGALNYTGHAVLGIRPEDLGQSMNDHNALFTATLEVIERMRYETVIYFRLNGDPMVARLENNIAALPGDNIAFAIKDDKWHLFEPGTEGKRICG